jgi:hypothetical protein
MDESQQDKRIQDLDDRIRKQDDRLGEVEITIKTAKIWIGIIIALAVGLGFSLKVVYDEYKRATDVADSLDTKLKAHQVQLAELDDWWQQRQKSLTSAAVQGDALRSPSQPPPLRAPAQRVPIPPQLVKQNQDDGLADLVKRIHDFSSRPGADYKHDVESLRLFALEYFLYIKQNPTTRDNGVVDAIDRAVDAVISRSDFSQDQYKQWHQVDAPRDFKDFIAKFDRTRRVLTPDDLDCYQSGLLFWDMSLSNGLPPLSDACRNRGINPYE